MPAPSADTDTVVISSRVTREEARLLDEIAARETRNRAQQIAHLLRLALRKDQARAEGARAG